MLFRMGEIIILLIKYFNYFEQTLRIESPGLLTRNTLDKGELKKQLDWQILPIRYNDCRSTDTLYRRE